MALDQFLGLMSDEAINTASRSGGGWHTVALGNVAQALALAAAYDRATNLARSIEDAKIRAATLQVIAQALAQSKHLESLLQLVQQSWFQASSREYILELLPMANGLIMTNPDLGLAFVEGFTWVNEFLKA